MDRLVDFGLPGLVFLFLVVWLVRKAIHAARTESDLESERLTGALAQELQAAKDVAKAATGGARTPRLVTPAPAVAVAAAPRGPLEGAELSGATAEHLALIEALVREREAVASSGGASPRIEVLWAKSTATHAVWCERRLPATPAAAAMTREVVCVARVENGKVIDRWTY
jgi:hypothetical protein